MFSPQFFRFAACFLVSAGLLVGQSQAKTPESIDWEKLIPPKSETLAKDIKELQATLDGLDEERREFYYQIDEQAALKRRVEAGFVDKNRLKPSSLERLEKDYQAEFPELYKLWERVVAARKLYALESERVDQSLDGLSVRMPGYVLPLETEGTALREFLLVPFVGACIHVPPPPANQMVHITVDQPYHSDELYEPVWVEGVLSIDKSTHALSLVDGKSDVSTGYSMRATKITPHDQ